MEPDQPGFPKQAKAVRCKPRRIEKPLGENVHYCTRSVDLNLSQKWLVFPYCYRRVLLSPLGQPEDDVSRVPGRREVGACQTGRDPSSGEKQASPSFLKKKKQKTFNFLSTPVPADAPQGPNLFGTFFKKGLTCLNFRPRIWASGLQRKPQHRLCRPTKFSREDRSPTGFRDDSCHAVYPCTARNRNADTPQADRVRQVDASAPVPRAPYRR